MRTFVFCILARKPIGIESLISTIYFGGREFEIWNINVANSCGMSFGSTKGQYCWRNIANDDCLNFFQIQWVVQITNAREKNNNKNATL